MGRLSLVEELLQSGRLVAPFTQRIKCPTHYCLVYPTELASRPGVKAVIDWLREEASKTGAHPTQESPVTVGGGS
jgi:LysR family glycine cleavage system transcriptional activator